MGFDVFATRVLLVVATALAAVSVVQTDFWWLLRAGHDIWHTGRVPLVDHYSYTANGHYWSNHEWLWEAGAYALHWIGGMPLVMLLVAGTVFSTLWVLLRLTRASGYVVPLVLVLTVPLVSVSWTTRPQVTSMMLFAITMLLLARERYLMLPVVFLVWANLHAQVVMGGVLLVVATATAGIRWLRSRSAAERTRLFRLALGTGAAAVATLANPLGTGLWSYVLGANGRPGQQAIAEWHNAFELNAAVFWFWAIVAVVGTVGVRNHDRLSTWEAQVPVAAALAMLPLSILAVRNIPFFVVAVTPLLMTVLEFRSRQHVGVVPRARRVLAAATALAAAAVFAAWALLPTGLGWRPVPADLADAVRNCPGHMFNGYDTGAALIWWVPEVKVFVDNRQDPYPAAVIDASMGLSQSAYPRTFARYDIGCALLPRTSALVPALQRDRWTTTYEDADSVVLVPSAPRATSETE
jgi:hypothetical protein